MHFLDLPSDITHLIYTCHFASCLVRITPVEQLRDNNVYDDVEVTGWNEILPLLLTCKHIHRNASPYISRATVRVDVISYYHKMAKYHQFRPHVTRALVPAIEHVWSCLTSFINPTQGAIGSKANQSIKLTNFQLCLYDHSSYTESGIEWTDIAAYANEEVEEYVAGDPDDGQIVTALEYAVRALRRLKPSLPKVAFEEIIVALELDADCATPHEQEGEPLHSTLTLVRFANNKNASLIHYTTEDLRDGAGRSPSRSITYVTSIPRSQSLLTECDRESHQKNICCHSYRSA